MIEGFDASGWTQEINFEDARKSGKEYGVYRVGRGIPDGATSGQGIDLQWFKFKAGSLKAGLKTGGYWRFFPTVDLNTQLDRFCLALGQSEGMLSPWVDIEDHGGLSPVDLTSWAIRALVGVERRTGRRPVLYTGKNFYDTRLQYWRLSNWEVAIAWQTQSRWPEYGACFWQYLLDVPAPWAKGRIDHQRYAFSDLKYNCTQNELRYQLDDDGMFHGPMIYTGKLLPEAGKQGASLNEIAIVHTMVGYLNGTDSSFRRGDNGLESHLGIGGLYDGEQLDGAVYQWMYVTDTADANYQANPYAFSIETSDGTKYLERWTVMQAESLAQCLAAWCLKYDRPARLMTSSKRSKDNRGIGHHLLGTVPNPQPGDDYWSPPASGPRACPGQTRIDQLESEVISRVQDILVSLNSRPPGGPGPIPEEPEMQLDDVIGQTNSGQPITVREALMKTVEMSGDLEAGVSAIRSDVKDSRNRVKASLNAKTHQPSWSDLGQKTWGELATQRWGHLSEV